MPAFVNSKLGESGMSDADGTIVCCLEAKKSKKDWRISLEVMVAKFYGPQIAQMSTDIF